MHEVAKLYRYAHDFLFMGRGYNFPVRPTVSTPVTTAPAIASNTTTTTSTARSTLKFHGGCVVVTASVCHRLVAERKALPGLSERRMLVRTQPGTGCRVFARCCVDRTGGSAEGQRAVLYSRGGVRNVKARAHQYACHAVLDNR